MPPSPCFVPRKLRGPECRNKSVRKGCGPWGVRNLDLESPGLVSSPSRQQKLPTSFVFQAVVDVFSRCRRSFFRTGTTRRFPGEAFRSPRLFRPSGLVVLMKNNIAPTEISATTFLVFAIFFRPHQLHATLGVACSAEKCRKFISDGEDRWGEITSGIRIERQLFRRWRRLDPLGVMDRGGPFRPDGQLMAFRDCFQDDLRLGEESV